MVLAARAPALLCCRAAVAQPAQLAIDADRFCLLGMEPNFGSEVILDAFD